MDFDEVQAFPQFAKEQQMYLAVRNLIVALWAKDCKVNMKADVSLLFLIFFQVLTQKKVNFCFGFTLWWAESVQTNSFDLQRVSILPRFAHCPTCLCQVACCNGDIIRQVLPQSECPHFIILKRMLVQRLQATCHLNFRHRRLSH